MNLQPTLQGRLLLLRPLTAEDFEQLYQAASDPKIWEQHPQPTRYKREEFQSYLDSAMASRGALVAVDLKTGEVIGSSRFHSLDQEKRQLVIGYTFLKREYWGGSFNHEMKRLMLDHAFQFVDTVVFQIGEKNIRSRKAIEAIGARLFGTSAPAGVPHVLYRVDKGDKLKI